MINTSLIKEVKLLLGIPTIAPTFKEIIVSSLTALLATICIMFISKELLSYFNVSTNSYILIPIAATSVLIFVVPHGALSQPWQVIIGNLVSAAVGVTCYQYFGNNIAIAAALSVSISIMAMSIFRCLHPPGGATALGAVLGGDTIYQLGYSYIFIPTLLNCLIIIVTAIVLNYPFHWRRYPSHLYYKKNQNATISPGTRANEVTVEDFMKAVSEHGSLIDITDEAWNEIFEKAKRHAEFDNVHPHNIELGHNYSNGKIGKQWEIREVLAIENKSTLKYIILTGDKMSLSGSCSVNDFISWSKFKVRQNDIGIWERTT
jgi:CBS-domain-containing membrane protein